MSPYCWGKNQKVIKKTTTIRKIYIKHLTLSRGVFMMNVYKTTLLFLNFSFTTFIIFIFLFFYFYQNIGILQCPLQTKSRISESVNNFCFISFFLIIKKNVCTFFSFNFTCFLLIYNNTKMLYICFFL